MREQALRYVGNAKNKVKSPTAILRESPQPVIKHQKRTWVWEETNRTGPTGAKSQQHPHQGSPQDPPAVPIPPSRDWHPRSPTHIPDVAHLRPGEDLLRGRVHGVPLPLLRHEGHQLRAEQADQQGPGAGNRDRNRGPAQHSPQ